MSIIRKISVFIIVISVIYDSCNNSSSTNKYLTNPDKRGKLRIMFYNVENLFDIYDDSLTQDDEFLPDGYKNWNYKRFNDKLNKLYKVIIAVGGWEPPEIIGLCEIENIHVLSKLVYDTPLSKYEYEIVHHNSPDNRGIDVTLLFREDKLALLKKSFYNISFPWDSLKKTRDILYFKGVALKKDTLHIFVNHWPSRYNGQLETESYRIHVASVLKNKVDSIFNINKKSKIIITGDFNDEPHNKSLTEYLSAKIDFDLASAGIESDKLYNLSYYLLNNTKLGSFKYEADWQIYDQFIVSGTLINSQKLKTSLNDVHIFSADFLLEKDDIYSGYRPFRTYHGYKYNGGFSDHLPVYLDLN